MVVNNTQELVRLIQNSTAEEAEKLLVQYGNTRSEESICNSWKYFRKMIKFMVSKDKLSIKDFLLAKDKDNPAFVSIKSLTKYLYKIDNVLQKLHENCSYETSNALSEIEDALEQNLEDIKIDFRISYSNDA